MNRTIELKPYTKYVCPLDTGDLGHRSIWTGAYRTPQPNDHQCSCGAQLVELDESSERWRLSWEMVSPFNLGEWHPVTKEHTNEHEARAQLNGLLQLQAEGEGIRNISLERATTAWEPQPITKQVSP